MPITEALFTDFETKTKKKQLQIDLDTKSNQDYPADVFLDDSNPLLA